MPNAQQHGAPKRASRPSALAVAISGKKRKVTPKQCLPVSINACHKSRYIDFRMQIPDTADCVRTPYSPADDDSQMLLSRACVVWEDAESNTETCQFESGQVLLVGSHHGTLTLDII
jgi:hypothetical protein